VNFKYPGHENDKLADSELGMIPEGWEVIEISEKFKTVLGGTPSRKNEDYWINGTVPWINSSMVNELRVIDHSELITKEALKQSSTKLMPTRTTVLAITGATLGQVSLLEEEVCANQSVVGVYDENKTFNEFIYMTLTHIIKRIINRAGGGAQQHINKEIVNSVKIFCPKQNVVGSFNNIIIPIFDEIKNMLFKNRNLRQTRDLLLPKLISGKIDVSDLDIDTSILHD
jgi:type I restriction enzyme S subunit